LEQQEQESSGRLQTALQNGDRFEIDTTMAGSQPQPRPQGHGKLAYDRLSAAVDSYAMAIGGQLLEEREFGRDHKGRLTDAKGRLAVCERRRQAIHTAYLRLRDPIPPVFDDARVYEELADLEERKIRLIHPLEQRLRRPSDHC
jgi:hypothetical protein